jgi:hypothetical protein
METEQSHPQSSTPPSESETPKAPEPKEIGPFDPPYSSVSWAPW